MIELRNDFISSKEPEFLHLIGQSLKNVIIIGLVSMF